MYTCVIQILTLIQGNVLLIHLVHVTSMPPAIGLHLTCVPVTRPVATGVNAIMDTTEMDLTAQVNLLLCLQDTSLCRNGEDFVTITSCMSSFRAGEI